MIRGASRSKRNNSSIVVPILDYGRGIDSEILPRILPNLIQNPVV
ncbi:MAG: hypothetical protein AB7U98_16280 [Candidatus Nitrosocosmicus sp.]